MVNGCTEGNVLLVFVGNNLSDACAEKKYPTKSAGCDESKEIAVVATSDTIVEPNAVMVLSFNAIVANSTMMTTRWPPDIAGSAVLGRNLHGRSFRLGRSDHCPVVRRGSQP